LIRGERALDPEDEMMVQKRLSTTRSAGKQDNRELQHLKKKRKGEMWV
jgi:hypothetical protein